MKLLMISGDRSLAEGKRGAFYNTLEEFHKYWDRIDIICPKIRNPKSEIRNNIESPKPQIPNVSNFENSNLEFVSNLFGNVYVHSSPWSLILQPFWIMREGLRILKTNNYELRTANYLMTVHEYPPFYNGIGARMLWGKTHVPYVLEIHHIPGHPKPADLKERFYKLAMRQFIKYDAAKAKAVRVVNQHQVPEFLIRAGVPESKIIYIPSLYIDLDIFKPITNYQLPITKQYDLIFIGRLAKNKGINLLLEAMSKIKIQMPNIKLLIVGDGPKLKSLKLETRNQKLETNVVFHGWANNSQEVAKLLNESGVLVVPSYNEGGPRVALEAMACGVPVLATPVGIVPDVIGKNERGVIINWDSESIAAEIVKLLNNPELCARYHREGIEFAKKFEKQAAIKNYAEKLQNLIKGYRKP